MKVKALLRKKNEVKEGVSAVGNEYKVQTLILVIPEMDENGACLLVDGNMVENRLQVDAMGGVVDEVAKMQEQMWVEADLRFSLSQGTSSNGRQYVMQKIRLQAIKLLM